MMKLLTHWGRETHICIRKLNIIVSDNGILPGLYQTIIWTNAGISLIWPLGINFNKMLTKIHTFSFKKMHLKLSSAKWWPFCVDLNVLILSTSCLLACHWLSHLHCCGYEKYIISNCVIGHVSLYIWSMVIECIITPLLGTTTHHVVIIPPEQRSCWGVYWFHSLRLSVRPSVRLSRLPCPLCNIYSSGWILSILATNDNYHEGVCRI